MDLESEKYCYRYPHPAVTTDCVIFGYDGAQLKVLLIERGNEPYKGRWAFPGGFLEIDEDAETGALRELREETGLTGAYVRQFHTFSSPQRDPRERIISIAYLAVVRLQEVTASDDAARARWFALDELPPLAFDHDEVLQKALQALRRLIHFEPIGLDLLPAQFTAKELQQLYEAILGVKLDGGAFLDQLLHIGLLAPTGATDGGQSNQEEQLYTFNPAVYEQVQHCDFRLSLPLQRP